jgi:hypothetical protein
VSRFVEVKCWLKLRHGKRTVNRHVIAGKLPMGATLSRAAKGQAKAKIRDEYLRTGRVVPDARAQEIVAAILFADVLIGKTPQEEGMEKLKLVNWGKEENGR